MRLRKALAAVAVLGSLSTSLLAVPFAHGPYACAPGPDTVTISWSGAPLTAATVEYAPLFEYTEREVLPMSLSFVPEGEDVDGEAHVVLEGLLPATDYVYRVVAHGTDGSDVVSPLGSFSTAPAPGEPVRFAVLADTQWQWEGINRLELVGDAIAADTTPFDLILHAGDLVESPSSSYWDHWFSAFDEMLLRAPFLPVLGNHERNHRAYYNAFQFPPGEGKAREQWWALHWGDVLIVGLDSTVTGADQYLKQQAWLKRHLAGSEPHKFVIFHYPVFSSDAYHGEGYNFDVIFHPIFVEHGVDVVLNGHAHNYERIERDGVTYLVLGGGGATPRPLAEHRTEGSVVAAEGRHFYARVATSSDGIDIDVVSVAREEDGIVTPTPDLLLDAFTITGRSPVGALVGSLLLIVGVAVGAALLWLLLRARGD
ncbi:MAG: metallophosphoesterase [Candidatus Bipolaricaulota bacterium]|nr:MAG: metallophosphoesterase [Candidatus Bipolaricaulota bacterium]